VAAEYLADVQGMTVTHAVVDVGKGVDSAVGVEHDRAARVDAALVALPPGWFWHGRPWLRLLDQHRPALAVELGAYNGASAIATARILGHWGGTLVAIDTWADGPAGPPHRQAAFTTHVEAAGITNIIPICGHTVSVARRWTSGLIDALYVDADHTDASVTADLIAWWPWLRDGGVIGGDDYGNRDYPGVARAWDRFATETGTALQFVTHAGAPFPLVWAVKGDGAPAYVPMPKRLERHATTCAVCHRVVWSDHLNDRGVCVLCVGA